MTISSLLTPDLVLPALAVDSKTAVLDALVARVARTHPHVDGRRLAEALHARERIASTALERGIAVPHARLDGLPGPLAALAWTPTGISTDAPDGQPTRIFLLLVVSLEQPGSHLRLLAAAARLLADDGCRADLLGARSADEAVAALRTHEARTGRAAA